MPISSQPTNGSITNSGCPQNDDNQHNHVNDSQTSNLLYSAVLEATFSEANNINNNNEVTNPNSKRRPYFVKHRYTDRSDEDCPVELLSEPTCRGGVKSPFPQRLHEMLETVENDNQENMISWQPHGRSFLIHKPEVFARQILPRFFAHSNFKSFQRQLNLWGFNRITQGYDKGAYYNEFFLRGKRTLTRCMQRQRVKGTSFRGRSCPESEPDFYSMTYVGASSNTGKSTSLPSSSLSTPTQSNSNSSNKQQQQSQHKRQRKLKVEMPSCDKNCGNALALNKNESLLETLLRTELKRPSFDPFGEASSVSSDLFSQSRVSENTALRMALELDDWDILMNRTGDDEESDSINYESSSEDEQDVDMNIQGNAAIGGDHIFHQTLERQPSAADDFLDSSDLKFFTVESLPSLVTVEFE